MNKACHDSRGLRFSPLFSRCSILFCKPIENNGRLFHGSCQIDRIYSFLLSHCQFYFFHSLTF